MKIDIPYNFTFRDYQKPQFLARAKGCNRFFKVWHRRAGKDITDINFTIMQALQEVGNYWHMLPEYNQARKAIWEGKTKDGRPYLDFFPPEIIKNIRRQEMQIELINGSIWRLVGSDNVNSNVGAGIKGVVFSEFALTNPQAWKYIEPMLLESKGWAVFNTTPRGENHAKDLWEKAKNNDKWFCQLLTIEDTKKEDGTPIISQEDIEEARKMGVDEETIQQEYYCSFEGSVSGAYYGEQLRILEKNNKIVDFPILQEYPVYTYWDLGKSDYTAVWFMQNVAGEYRLIDYYYIAGGDIDIFARMLKEKNYRYAEHNLPHDAGHLRVGMKGKTIKQQLEIAMPNEKFNTMKVSRSVQSDIIATRSFLLRCAFQKTQTLDGVEALKNYTKKWSDRKNMYEDYPDHNWASHGADAFRECAIHNIEKANIPVRPVSTNGMPSFNDLMTRQFTKTNNRI